MKLSKRLENVILLFPVLFFFVLYGGHFLVEGIALALAHSGNENYFLQDSLWEWGTGLRLGSGYSCLFALVWILLLLGYRQFPWKKRFACCGGYLLWFCVIFLFAVLPETGAAREKAKRISCTSNLKQIYNALREYEADYGVLPPSLQTLDRCRYLGDDSVFRCPSRSVDPEFTDYEYYGKSRSLKEKRFMLLEDRARIHRCDYRNSLWSDGGLDFGYGPKRVKPE